MGKDRLAPIAERVKPSAIPLPPLADRLAPIANRFSPIANTSRRIGGGIGRVFAQVKGLGGKEETAPEDVKIVEFDHVTKVYRTKSDVKWILRDANFHVKRGKSLALLGKNGTGKSTLFRLLAGVEQPSEGTVTRGVRVSWPLGFGGGFNTEISARENCIFVSRIYDTDIQKVIEFVEDFAELGNYFDMPVRTYSSGMRARLAFGLSMAVDFECYLIDEITAVGDKRFKEKCREAFAERRETADVIMISHSVPTIRAYCDVAAVLNNGKLIFYEDLDEAISIYKSL